MVGRLPQPPPSGSKGWGIEGLGRACSRISHFRFGQRICICIEPARAWLRALELDELQFEAFWRGRATLSACNAFNPSIIMRFAIDDARLIGLNSSQLLIAFVDDEVSASAVWARE